MGNPAKMHHGFDKYTNGMPEVAPWRVAILVKMAILTKIGPKIPGGGGDSHKKQTGTLIVSLRAVNFGFWSRLGCSGQSANILSRQGLV